MKNKLKLKKYPHSCRVSVFDAAVTRIRTWVTSATTKGTNHYTITAIAVAEKTWFKNKIISFINNNKIKMKLD